MGRVRKKSLQGRPEHSMVLRTSIPSLVVRESDIRLEEIACRKLKYTSPDFPIYIRFFFFFFSASFVHDGKTNSNRCGENPILAICSPFIEKLSRARIGQGLARACTHTFSNAHRPPLHCPELFARGQIHSGSAVILQLH